MEIDSNYTFLFVIAFPFLLFAGCEDRSINPFEENRGTYSIYGALELNESPSYVRVKDLSIPFLSESAKELDAEVAFENLQEGTSTTLRDTIVNFGGNYTHNFIINQQLNPQTSYKLTVDGSDGESISSTVTTPAITQVTLSEIDTVQCSQSITFTYKNVPEPENIQMEIGFKYDGHYRWSEIGKVDQLEHSNDADEMFLTLSPRQLLVEVFPPSGIDNPGIDPLILFPTVSCDELDSGEVRVKYIHFGPEWDLISEEQGPMNPLVSPDVENGLGFLGAYRRGEFTFEISTQ